jgi:hypothetical protein
LRPPDVSLRRTWAAKGEGRGLGAEALRFLTPDTGADVRRRVMARSWSMNFPTLRIRGEILPHVR